MMKKPVLLFIILIGLLNPLYANTQSSITVDYAVDWGASNQVASGLLHGISADYPAQYLIDGIKVNAVRGADFYGYLPHCYEVNTYNRIKATGADLMIGLYYRAVENNYWPGDNGDWQTWRDICTDLYNEAQSSNYDVYSWITWNEPRLQWSDLNRYRQAHQVAYETIKALDPAARIQAPEDHAYSLSFLSDFLTYCRDNGCLPDVLSWHELSQDPLDVEAHCSEIKSWMQSNGITPMPIAVTEYQGSSYSNDNTSIPGVNIYYLASMERAVQYGFAFGLHSCWSWGGSDSNFIATLADMANKDGANLPRGLWWNYNAYKDMTGRKVLVNVSGSAGDALASLDNGMKRSIILIGTKNYTTYHDVSLNLNNIPDSLTYNGKVHIRAEMIRDAMVLMSPEIMVAGDYSVSGGAVVLNLPTLDPKASYMVYISPATSDTSAISYESESLIASFTSGRTYNVFSEVEASGGQAAVLEATADGDYIEYQIPAPGEGVYNLSAILKSLDNRGFMQLYINDESTCPPEDLYNVTEGYYENDFGNIYVGPGDLYLKFVVVGQNPSSSGKWIVFDRFDLTKLNCTAGHFDMGTSDSPVMNGYTRVTETTASGTYRWTDGTGLGSSERQTGDDMERDFVFCSSAKTFEVDVKNETYEVTVSMGNDDVAHDDMVIMAEGSTVASDIDSDVNEIIDVTFDVEVTDGGLSLEFSDAGGNDINWLVNGLSFNVKGLDTTAPAAPTGLTATDGSGFVSLDWADNNEPDLASYNVKRAVITGGPYTTITTGETTSDYTDNTVIDGITYYYVVTAVDTNNNESGFSNEIEVTVSPMLIAHYEMEDNVNDSSFNGYHGTPSGSPAYTTGEIGQAIDLDGSDDFVTLPGGILDVGNVTVTAWVNWDGGGDWQRIFDFGNNTDEYMFLTPSSGSGNNLRFAITKSSYGSEQIIETSQLASGQWVHVAVTLNGNTGTLYVNGSPVATNTSMTLDPIDISPQNNYIGDSQWSPDPLLDGRIDDFRIYNFALTADQIVATMVANCERVQSMGYRMYEDINGDCQIGTADLMLLIDQWLSTSPAAVPPNYSPDIVADNEINLADFAAMAEQWLVCNNPEVASCIENW